jgi:hypothetical protein
MPKQLSIPSPRFGSRRDDQVASNRPSFSRRVFRTITRFFIAVFIGVGATLAWQSYGDAAREMVAERAPTLAWLLLARDEGEADAIHSASEVDVGDQQVSPGPSFRRTSSAASALWHPMTTTIGSLPAEPKSPVVVTRRPRQ